MINNALDTGRIRAELARQRRVQIADFLQQDAAERLRDCLLQEVPWSLAHRVDGRAQTLAPDQLAGTSLRAEILAQAQQAAGEGFMFCYDSYMMVRARGGGLPQVPLLMLLLDFLNSEDVLGFMRWLTGNPRIGAANAQATRYLPGQFLTRHGDEHREERRSHAFVLNLSPQWHSDWGGLLQFTDPQDQVVQTFLPRFNSLSLFQVPQPHAVTLVSPWAQQPRLAVTGWFLETGS